MTGRVCAKPGCNAKVKPPRLLCTAHWFELPANIRAKIVRHLSSGNHDSARIVLDDWFNSGELHECNAH